MKREMALIETILARAEGNGEWLNPPEISDYTPAQVMYHVNLCGQAEFLEVRSRASFGNPARVMMKSLTWKGHTELERLRGN